MSGTALFGRSSALAAARELLDAASERRPALGLVTGEAGIGRTSFLRAVAEEEAVGRFQVAFTRGSLTGHTLPFGVAGELLGGLLAQQDEPIRDELLAIGGGAVQRMLNGDHSAAAESDTAEMLSRSRALCHAATIRTPLLVAVDDARLVDPHSQRWLADLGGSGVGVAVLLADTALPSPVGHDLLPEILAARRIRLSGLEAPAVRRFVHHVFGVDLDGEQQQALVTTTGGVPILVREVMRDLVERRSEITVDSIGSAVPRAVADDLRSRLAACDPALSALVRAVAILRDNSVLPMICRLSGHELPVVLSAADALSTAGVLGDSQPLRFAHPVVGDAVRRHLPIGDMISGQLCAARILHETGGDVTRIADHLMAAGPSDLGWAADTLRAAAVRERAEGRPQRAAACLRQAVREPLPGGLRPTVLRELGEAELVVAPAAALRSLTDARRLTDDTRARGELSLLIADALVDLGRDGDALASLASAIADGDAGIDADTEPGEARLRLRLHAAHTDIAMRAIPADPPSAAEEQQPDRPDEPAWMAVRAIRRTDHGEDRAEVVRLAMHMLRAAPADGPLTRAYWHAVCALTYADELQTAAEFAVHGHETAVRAGWPRHIAAALRCRGLICARQGDLVVATELLAESTETSRHAGIDASFDHRMSVSHLVESLVRRGLTAEARERLRAAGPLDRSPRDRGSGHLLHVHGLVRCAGGDLRAGAVTARRAGRLLRAFGVRNPTVAGWRRTAVLAQLDLAQPAAAVQLADENLAAARRWGTSRDVGLALHTRALSATGTERVGLLRAAVAWLERSPARAELADALVDLGVARHDG